MTLDCYMIQDLQDLSKRRLFALHRHGRETYFSVNRVPHGFEIHRRSKNRTCRRIPSSDRRPEISGQRLFYGFANRLRICRGDAPKFRRQ